MKALRKLLIRLHLVTVGLMVSGASYAAAVASPGLDDVTGTITNFTALVTTVGMAMLTVNIIVRLLSKPKRAG